MTGKTGSQSNVRAPSTSFGVRQRLPIQLVANPLLTLTASLWRRRQLPTPNRPTLLSLITTPASAVRRPRLWVELESQLLESRMSKCAHASRITTSRHNLESTIWWPTRAPLCAAARSTTFAIGYVVWAIFTTRPAPHSPPTLCALLIIIHSIGTVLSCNSSINIFADFLFFFLADYIRNLSGPFQLL